MIGDSNTVVSAYTLYRHLQKYYSHPSIQTQKKGRRYKLRYKLRRNDNIQTKNDHLEKVLISNDKTVDMFILRALKALFGKVVWKSSQCLGKNIVRSTGY